MADRWDDVAKEADLLALHIATGTLRGPVDLGPDDPKVPDTEPQRTHRARLAKRRARKIDHARQYTRAFEAMFPNATRRTR